jgi:hypothetical protein
MDSPTLTTLEGNEILEGELGLSIKKIGKKIGSAAKSAAKTTAKAATAAYKPSTYVKAGRFVNKAISAAMPAALKRKVRDAVKKVVGSQKITSQTKAVVLPSVTAAAMAIPGIQPFALAVPVVVNAALDEIVSQASKQATEIVQKATQAAAQASKIGAIPARTKLVGVKEKILEAKAKADAEVAQIQEENADGGSGSIMKPALITGAALVALGTLYYVGKKGHAA